MDNEQNEGYTDEPGGYGGDVVVLRHMVNQSIISGGAVREGPLSRRAERGGEMVPKYGGKMRDEPPLASQKRGVGKAQQTGTGGHL